MAEPAEYAQALAAKAAEEIQKQEHQVGIDREISASIAWYELLIEFANSVFMCEYQLRTR